jgi:hypothetical protein
VKRLNEIFLLLPVASHLVPTAVPDVAWQKVAMSTWHCDSLEARFRRQKAASKPFKDAFYAMLVCEINKFPLVRPGALEPYSLATCLLLGDPCGSLRLLTQ